MGRPRKFDHDSAIDTALEVFWKHGYQGASLPLLTEAMGMNRGSFYAAFGDKASLFRQVMARYQDTLQGVVVELLADRDDPVGGIQRAFELTLLSLPEEHRQLGCLLVNTVTELPQQQAELADEAGRRLANVEHAFTRACQRAIELEQMRDGIAADDAGQLLMTTMVGLRVLARQGVDTPALRKSVVLILQLLFISSAPLSP